MQDSVQSFHWGGEQTTVHPFVFYHREREGEELKTSSFAVISDRLKHDTISVIRVAGLGRLSAGANMAMKPFVQRVITIFATNASFLRIISNFQI